jgi:hypothetical protein
VVQAESVVLDTLAQQGEFRGIVEFAAANAVGDFLVSVFLMKVREFEDQHRDAMRTLQRIVQLDVSPPVLEVREPRRSVATVNDGVAPVSVNAFCHTSIAGAGFAQPAIGLHVRFKVRQFGRRDAGEADEQNYL